MRRATTPPGADGSGAPDVSVLLPARDAAATLREALASVLGQGGVDLECVVVDDGSTDRTAEILRRHAREDPRVRVLERPREGLVAALEAGRRACRGAFVARMDADDVMLPGRLAVQHDALRRDPTLAGVGCRVRLFPSKAVTRGMRTYEGWLNSLAATDDGGRLDPWPVARDAFVECTLAHPTWMVRREVLDRFGYRDMGWPEDYDLLLRLLSAGERLAAVPRVLHRWRRHPTQTTRLTSRYGRGRFQDCKAAFLAEGLLSGGVPWVLWGYGGTGHSLVRSLEPHGCRPAAIVDVHPGRVGNVIRGVPVIWPWDLGDRLKTLGARRDLARVPVVASVAGAEPRGLIRARLDRLGLRETVDYVVTA